MFNDLAPSIPRVVNSIAVLCRAMAGKPTCPKLRCLSFLAADYPYPQGYFDRAEQRGSCGARAVLFLSPLTSYHLSTAAGVGTNTRSELIYHLSIAVGVGTNTRSELIALWILLWFAQYSTINSLWIFGDSRCIVDWATKKAKLSSILLNHWMCKVERLLSSFDSINIHHIYREFNSTADFLSCRFMGTMDGLLLREEFRGDALQSSRLWKLF